MKLLRLNGFAQLWSQDEQIIAHITKPIKLQQLLNWLKIVGFASKLSHVLKGGYR